TWLAVPRLDAALDAALGAALDSALERATASGTRESEQSADKVLAEAGHHLGLALAPVVAALNLAEIVLSGPARLLDGALMAATVDTLRTRTSPQFHGHLAVRMTTLGDDIVTRGAAAMVLSGQLGVS